MPQSYSLCGVWTRNRASACWCPWSRAAPSAQETPPPVPW